MDIPYADQLERIIPTALRGSVSKTEGLAITVMGFPAPIGALARIERDSLPPLDAEVVGFEDNATILYPRGEVEGVRRGNPVTLIETSSWVRVGDRLLGRVIDAHGNVMDDGPSIALQHRVPVDAEPPKATQRKPIEEVISTGVRVIDGFMTCGQGQRLGIFAGSGVGKSTLMGMMARYTDAEVIVIGLIGERGRELNEFIKKDLGREGLKRSVVVAATSDQPALNRVRAAQTALSVAEYFRDQGKNVLLLMDSLTRFAMAQRQVGLAAGEPPTTRGYTPSVFEMLPKLVERAGCSPKGSITAFFTVLCEGDDENEPITDAVRGLIDGHVWLSRKIATKNHYPAVDMLASISRLMTAIASPEHQEAAGVLRSLLATYQENEDLILVGAYRKGTDPNTDVAVAMKEEFDNFLKQQVDKPSTFEETMQALLSLAGKATEMLNQIKQPQRKRAAQQQQQPAGQQLNQLGAPAQPSEPAPPAPSAPPNVPAPPGG